MGFLLNKVKFDTPYDEGLGGLASIQHAANASQESLEESPPPQIPLYVAVFTYPSSDLPQAIESPLCIISTSTSPSVITSSTLRKYYPNLPWLTCMPASLPTHPLSTYSLPLSTSFVILPLVFKDPNRDRVGMKHIVYVVESDEEDIVLGVDFLRKEGLDLRWAEGLGGIDCLVKTEGGEERGIPFFVLQWRQ